MPVSLPGFTAARLERLVEMERSHFWFAGRRDLIDALLQQYLALPQARLADIGCGGGYYCQLLSGQGYRMTAIDFLPGGLQRLRRDAPSVQTVQSGADPLALRSSAFDGALALDVLEHVDDDAAAAAELYRILKPGGVLIATVPAFEWLWSYRDDAAGHRRRYRRKGFAGLLTSAGFVIERSGYYNCFLLPVAAASRAAGRLAATATAARDLEDLPPPLMNRLFRVINRAEARWSRTHSWPFGSSLYAVARRTAAF